MEQLQIQTTERTPIGTSNEIVRKDMMDSKVKKKAAAAHTGL